MLLEAKRHHIFFFRYSGSCLLPNPLLTTPPKEGGHRQRICIARWYHFLELFEDFRNLNVLGLFKMEVAKKE